jgi:hypothetical protein
VNDGFTTGRLTGYLNEAHREILSLPGAQHLRHATRTFASETDRAEYGLLNLTKVLHIRELDNDRYLEPMSLAQYRNIDPDPASVTGTPTHWIWVGYGPVDKQPANASELFAKSTSASDDNTKTVYFEADDSANRPVSGSTTLNGTTAVNLMTGTTFLRVRKWFLSSNAVGTVTLHEDSGAGTELASIGRNQTSQRYYRLILYPTPSSAITYHVDYEPETTDMLQDTDEPLIPQEWHDLLVFGAESREYEKTDDTRYEIAERRYQRRLAQFKYAMHETPAGATQLGSVQGPLSRLGPWFPAGS